ncbi:hypothetical protein MMC19_007725 [Ptychographa xylographoides]|nr:hypothetical protein [Ptychographa xylographoides]
MDQDEIMSSFCGPCPEWTLRIYGELPAAHPTNIGKSPRNRDLIAAFDNLRGLHVAQKHIMASESRLYTFSPETTASLRKFRLGTSRAKDPQGVIYQIDKHTLEILQVDDVTYSDMQELADELPGHSPRYILLSHPVTLASGRMSVPYVMIYYLPVTCNAELRMLYAGAKELMRNTAEVGKVIEMAEAEELENIGSLLGNVE